MPEESAERMLQHLPTAVLVAVMALLYWAALFVRAHESILVGGVNFQPAIEAILMTLTTAGLLVAVWLLWSNLRPVIHRVR